MVIDRAAMCCDSPISLPDVWDSLAATSLNATQFMPQMEDYTRPLPSFASSQTLGFLVVSLPSLYQPPPQVDSPSFP